MTLQELFSAHKLAIDLQETEHTIDLFNDPTNSIQPVKLVGISGEAIHTIDGEQIRDVIVAGYERTRADLAVSLLNFGVLVDPVAVAAAPAAYAAPSVVGA